jgi:hypothetical protein
VKERATLAAYAAAIRSDGDVRRNEWRPALVNGAAAA